MLQASRGRALMFMRLRLSVEVEGSRNKQGILSHGKGFTGQDQLSWSRAVVSLSLVLALLQALAGPQGGKSMVPGLLALPKLHGPCQSFMGSNRAPKASEPKPAEFSVVIRANQCLISKEVSLFLSPVSFFGTMIKTPPPAPEKEDD